MVATVNTCSSLLRLLSFATLFEMGFAEGAVPVLEPPPAYGLAAQRMGVPAELLFAVALQESGIILRGQRLPWPWTLNVTGGSRYFYRESDACDTLQRALKQHPTLQIDAGLTQINLGHQRHFYRHPCELLRPHRNVEVAATILRNHHRQGEDWLLAAGRYHRPAGGPLAARYRHRIRKHLDQLASKRRLQP
ncbi:transglycosylase SLT domain-containing protein [Pseudomonas sp. B21-054]|uniref:transglycosylase SLT domain-containing protein n=1 Tax=Pseudomonas sp. B21-054 TaxID=2895494 RepID=UPI00222EAC29|nr:transglycosylase SLT domain-containing protein [Pseudomonas sp. B21-054]UZE16050.1 transglycosylase SLT domain-containing protein [Pseudomonas sp. B21-054]